MPLIYFAKRFQGTRERTGEVKQEGEKLILLALGNWTLVTQW